MIVRISNEGQYEISAVDAPALGELDNEAVAACESDDEQRFRETFERLLSFIRAHGRPVPDDELVASEVIFPPPDVSLAEASKDFSGEGLIPG
jgi:5-deoxy-D-glucuronate isomerase